VLRTLRRDIEANVGKGMRDEAPDVVVAPLSERETAIAAHFSKPEVQYISSTSRWVLIS
jgi:hypothetical protein